MSDTSSTVEGGSTIDEKFCGTPLHLAVFNSDTNITEILLATGANVNALNSVLIT